MKSSYQQPRSESTHELETAWGDLLDVWTWTHFATLTFARPVGEEGARLEFGRWIRRLQQRSRGKVGRFYAAERGSGGLLHLHALIEASLPPEAAQAAWLAGRAEVVPYDRTRGARFYVTKGIGTSDLMYEFLPLSKASPRSG